MNVEQIYTKCLSQGTYYIQSDGEAAVIDPLREINSYLQMAQKNNATIKYIFETHFHADFVSGHITLAEKTGATIVYGPNADPNFKAYIARDNERFQIGKITLQALHTPGHTMESTTYLLIDENGNQKAIFSGDTLFLGDVGRPDLAQKAANMTQEKLAGILYDSLRQKIMPLADDIIVYPGHGAGSSCGKNMMKETTDTLGNQKKTNYALRLNMTREEFVEEVTEGLLPPPTYFPLNVKLNKEGYQSIDKVLKQGLKPLSTEKFEAIIQQNILVLDVRKPADFAKGHIPNSIFIGLDGNFAPWVGALLGDISQPIAIVAPQGREQETITRLARIGFDNTKGYLKGGILSWQKANKPITTINSVPAADLQKNYEVCKDYIFDVRDANEYQNQHIVNAHHTPLGDLANYLETFPQKKSFYVHCAGGYRSMIAASILKRKGFNNLIEVQGGFRTIQQTHIPLTKST